MRTKLLLTFLCAVVLGSAAARADDGFYVIPIPAGVGTKISSVPYTISTPGFYYLGGNLSYTGAGNAISVNTDDVTIDLMGYSIVSTAQGSYRYGIYLHGRRNVEIRNGTIRDFIVGIFDDDTNALGHRVSNIRTPGNYQGILFMGTNHIVAGCTASNNPGGGIFINEGIVSGCTAQGSGNRGIDICNGLIKNCYSVSNRIGFQILSGSAIGNVAIGNTDYGFLLSSTEAPLVLDQNSASGSSSNYYGGTAATAWGTNAGR